jgi:hypothetical protein
MRIAAEVRGQFGDPQEEEPPPLEAVTKEPVKTAVENNKCVPQWTADCVDPLTVIVTCNYELCVQ